MAKSKESPGKSVSTSNEVQGKQKDDYEEQHQSNNLNQIEIES